MKNTNHTSSENSRPEAKNKGAALRLVAWETTRNCNLACVHCRASAEHGPFSGELDTRASFDGRRTAVTTGYL